MKRRMLIAGFTGTMLSSLLFHRSTRANDKDAKASPLIEIKLGERFELSIDSSEIDVTDEWRKEGWGKGNQDAAHRERVRPVRLNWGALHLSRGKRLTGFFDAELRFVKDVDYWISVAVFDGDRRLLGAAVHHEPLELNGGFIEQNGKRFELDFGISAAFETAKLIAVSISDRRDLETK